MQDRTRRALSKASHWAADVAAQGLALAIGLIIATPVAGVILFAIGWWMLG